MVRLLVREGEEDQIWRWMRCETTRPTSLPGYVKFEWRGTALKGLVMYKAQLSTNQSLDEAIRTYFDAAKSFYVPAGGASTWLKSQIEATHSLADHERDPSINGGRSWTCVWPNTDPHLWQSMIQEVCEHESDGVEWLGKFSFYNTWGPDPYPILADFEDAIEDPDHRLWNMLHRHGSRVKIWRLALRASEEFRRHGNYDEAARLDVARLHLLPPPKKYGDCKYGEGVFAQAKQSRPLPPPKFKPW